MADSEDEIHPNAKLAMRSKHGPLNRKRQPMANELSLGENYSSCFRIWTTKLSGLQA